MLRFLTSGESHGPRLTAILDGVPAGLPVDLDAVNRELSRRQGGYGRGARQKIESDRVEIVGGIRHGVTSGAPLGLVVENRDWENWRHVMAVDPVDVSDEAVADQLKKKQIARFRPGHADLPGTLKFRQSDIRDVLERASARETAARVAVGGICQQLIGQFGVRMVAHVVQVGEVVSPLSSHSLTLLDLEERVAEDEMYCADGGTSERMKELIKKAWQDGDSLGGVVEVLTEGLPVGLGSYTQWDRRLDGRLAQAAMSIQAIKAVEIGDGVAGAAMPGSQVHDALYPVEEQALFAGLPFSRKTNHAGGLEGGMTNGERLVVRAYMKPIPTLRKGLPSVSFPDFDGQTAHYERSDVSAISAASVVVKAMVSFVVADAFIEKFGGDTLTDMKNSVAGYISHCRALGSSSGSIAAHRRAPAEGEEAEEE